MVVALFIMLALNAIFTYIPNFFIVRFFIRKTGFNKLSRNSSFFVILNIIVFILSIYLATFLHKDSFGVLFQEVPSKWYSIVGAYAFYAILYYFISFYYCRIITFIFFILRIKSITLFSIITFIPIWLAFYVITTPPMVNIIRGNFTT